MKKFRSFRNKKKHLSSKYILLILTGVCIVALFTSLVFNLSGGPLNSVAGYVFVPMQKGINNAGSWISGKANDFQTLGEVLKENKKLQNQVDDLTNQLNVTKLEQYELDNYRELLDLDDKYSGYQEGILIGYIASIEKNANNLTKSGTITPVVDFQHLREVLVITTLKDTGEKELSSQKASDTQTETQDNTETQKSQE